MTKRRGKIKQRSKLMIIVSSIVMLSAMGISYGYWNDGLKIITSVSTGEMDVKFCKDNYRIEVINGEGDIYVEFIDDDTMKITGEVSHDFEAFLHYCVINDGDIPVKLIEKNMNNISINHQQGVLRPLEYQYNTHGDPKIHIDAKDLVDGQLNYKFNATLKFGQWNK